MSGIFEKKKLRPNDQLLEMLSPIEMRNRIYDHQMHNPLIHRVMELQRYGGFDNVDTMTMLAFHALCDSEDLMEQVLELNQKIVHPIYIQNGA
jgi:hypothetical protein